MTLKELGTNPIRWLRRRKPICVVVSTPLAQVVEEMNQERRGAVAVVDTAGKLVGIFSIRDLMRRVNHAHHAWHDLPVSEAMTTNPICVAEDDSLSTALRRMEEGGFRHLPRVDAQGRPTAILSVRDILVYVSEKFPKEFVNVPPGPEQQARQPWGG
jgi:CBS domain-containing protein